MATKVWSTPTQEGSSRQQPKKGEEVFYQDDSVSLCLLLNRHAKAMRVVDFRAGPTSTKRMLVLSLARRHGMDKVYTLVERDEVATWLKLGFAKEGSIPGFYKRSDAFLLGCSAHAPHTLPYQGESRIVMRPTGLDLVTSAPEEHEDPAEIAAQQLSEKTLTRAKKLVKESADRQLPPVKIKPLREAEARKAAALALKSGKALTGFEPFGRDVERAFFSITASGGFELVASSESQSCFGNAFIELLTAPHGDSECLTTIAALRALSEHLLGAGIVSSFALAPSDDVSLATAYVYNGFRRTGLLQSHVMVGAARKDAIVWSRKLANPADD